MSESAAPITQSPEETHNLLASLPDRRWLLLLLFLAIVNSTVWSLTVPFDGAPDEIDKYDVVYFIWKYHRMPVFGPGADMYLRPEPTKMVPYVLGVAATYPVGAYLMSALLMYLSPWQNPAALLHTARLVSTLWALAALYVTHEIVLAVFGSRRFALGVTAFVAFIPQFTFVSAYVNDDAYTVAAVTWVIWNTMRGIKDGWTPRNSLLMGLALVMASMGKQNGWIAAFPFVLLALWTAWGSNWRQRVNTWAVMCVPPAATLGTWLLRNELVYGDPMARAVGKAGYGELIAVSGSTWLGTRLADEGFGYLDMFFRTSWLKWLFESFWGFFYYMNLWMDWCVYFVLLVGCVAGVAGTLWALFSGLPPVDRMVKLLGIAAAVAFILLFAATATTSLYNDFQPQGRYFFPLIAPIVVFLTAGGHFLVKAHGPRFVTHFWIATVALLFSLNVFALVNYVAPYPYPVIPLPGF